MGRSRPLVERLAEKVAFAGPADCWMWQASTRDGYGQIRVGRSVRSAHLVMYEIIVGPVPAGLELDHLCWERRCVNPAHLEPVPHRENLLRSPLTSAARHLARRSCDVPGCAFCNNRLAA